MRIRFSTQPASTEAISTFAWHRTFTFLVPPMVFSATPDRLPGVGAPFRRPLHHTLAKGPHEGTLPSPVSVAAGGSAVVGIVPNEAAITRLIGALPLEQNDETQLQSRYMQLEGLQQPSDDQPARLFAVIS